MSAKRLEAGTILLCGHPLEPGRIAYEGVTKRCLACASQRGNAPAHRNPRVHRLGSASLPLRA